MWKVGCAESIQSIHVVVHPAWFYSVFLGAVSASLKRGVQLACMCMLVLIPNKCEKHVQTRM